VTSFLALGPVLNAARMDDGVRTDDLSAHANGCGEALRPLEERRKELRTTMMSIFTGSDPRLRCDQGEFASAMLARAGLLLIVLSPIIVIGAPFLVVYPRIRRSRTAGQAAADEWNATKFAFLVSLVVAVCWTAYALPVTWGDVGIILIPMIGIPLSVGAGIVAWAVAKLAPK